MSKKDFSVALKYVEARPRSQRRRGAEARVSGISVGGSGVSATDLSLLQANLISVTNNFTALKDLFDSMFEKDSDGNIHAKLSLWSSGGITAGGVGSGGSGGGGISYNRLDSWSDYSADKAGYVLSALLGKDLDNRVSALANAGYITASYLAPYALRSEIPSLDGYFLASNFNQANLKSTLGISDWALASAKPTYTASEVGALSVNGGHIYGSLYITKSSKQVYIAYEGASESLGYIGFNGKNSPIYIPSEANVIYSLIHSGNYSDYALSVNGGTVNGSITASSFIGKLTGNADSANFVAKTYANENINFAKDESKIRLVSGVASNSTDLGFPKQYTAGLSVVSSYCGWQMVCYGSNIDYNPYYRSVTDKGVWGSWRQIAFLTDNVASATKLATPRTIWGQSFDGTGDITGDIMFAGPNKIAWHNDKNNYYISSPTTSTSAYLEYNAYGGHSFLGGNVAIGGGPSYEKLHVHGNGKFEGSVTASSLTIGGATITYDSVNKALCINGNMYALGGVTAGGAGISAYTSLEARVARLEQQLNIS